MCANSHSTCCKCELKGHQVQSVYFNLFCRLIWRILNCLIRRWLRAAFGSNNFHQLFRSQTSSTKTQEQLSFWLKKVGWPTRKCQFFREKLMKLTDAKSEKYSATLDSSRKNENLFNLPLEFTVIMFVCDWWKYIFFIYCIVTIFRYSIFFWFLLTSTVLVSNFCFFFCFFFEFPM